jgi:NHLM bacteriocin system ABC transporter ATP-binding protein
VRPEIEQEEKNYRLTTNQSILLNDPSRAWLVIRGHLAIQSTPIHDDAPVGLRRTLFSVRKEGVIFGTECLAETEHLGFIGVVSEETEVVELQMKASAGKLVSRYESYIGGWVTALSEILGADLEQLQPTVRATGSAEYGLSKQDILTADGGKLLLARMKSGCAEILGLDHLILKPEDGWLLVTPELCLQVSSDSAEIVTQLLSSNGGPVLSEGLATLHVFVNRHLARLAAEEERAELERRKASATLRDLDTAVAFHDLASVLDPIERFQKRETRLLTALGIVGDVMGIKISGPAASEDMTKVNDPIEPIARASRIHHRSVTLGPGWWKHDAGPLLGFIGEEHKAVALLPRGGEYDIVDPEVRYRQPLTAEHLAHLAPEAYMLYRPLPSRMTGVKDLLRFTLHGHTRDGILILLCGLCAALLGMITPKVTGTLIDQAIPNAQIRLLTELGAVLFAAAIATAVFTYIQVMTTVRVGTASEYDSQSGMWGRLVRFRPNFFRRYSSGDLQMRVNAVGEVSRELNSATMRPLITGLMALLNFFLLWYYSWTLAKVAIWFGLVILVVTAVMSYFIARMSYELTDLQGAFHGLMVQMVGGVGKLRVAGAEHRAFNHWVSHYTPQLRLMKRSQLLKDLVSMFNLSVPTAALGFLFWKAQALTVGLKPTDPNYITIGEFIAFTTAFTIYLAGWTDVSNTLVSVIGSILKGRRIKPILDEAPEVAEDASDPGRLKGVVTFEGVSFRYATDGPLILDDVSFTIKPGEFVAFVGPSGSGKSTIMRLLLGFERPQSGRILYDGQDLAGLDVLAVRRQIGAVLQNGRLNSGSIVENVANNAKLSHAEIWDAIASAGMNEDVENMPMGLHTVVAEGGVNFSGGQRQRLLIARALATRPRIVFFDEATSALDNKTQAIVTETLERRKVTRVTIAHRLSTIRKADKIYVIDRGRMVQQGTFEDMSRRDGTFKDLISRQMA